MQKTFIQLLWFVTRRYLTRFNPRIIGVTGSVGKTSVCEAISLAVQTKYTVRHPKKNYNTPIGLPLAVLGENSPGRSPMAWAGLFYRAFTAQSAPQFIVLEYGADAPGDILALTKLVTPEIAVITAISPVHLVNYPSLNDLIEEKATLGDKVPATGLVILNNDDRFLALMKNRFTAPILSYGFKSAAIQGKVQELKVDQPLSHQPTITTNFAITVNRSVDSTPSVSISSDSPPPQSPLFLPLQIHLTDTVSNALPSAALAAVAVAVHLNLNLQAVATALGNLKPLPGRGRIISGIKNSLIIDDSYNAAPASMAAGLIGLGKFKTLLPDRRRLAVIGKMAELGDRSDAEHAEIGKLAFEVADILIFVGELTRTAMHAALSAGADTATVEWFSNPVEAARFLDRYIKFGDIIYVKGSQSARMEKVVYQIMAQPLQATKLLVRQEAKWLAD